MSSSEFYKISNYAYYRSTSKIDVNMSDNIEEIGAYAYAETQDIRVRKLSNNLKVIKEFAFSNSNIEEINIPSSVEKIGIRAFSECKKLKRVIIPEGVLEIGDAAFVNCKNLEEVYLPNSLKKLSAQMFLNCPKLKYVHLPDGTTHLPNEFFKGCSSLDMDLDYITSIGEGVFNNCKSLSRVPASLISFNPYDFKGCKNIKEAHINANVTHLPDHLFDGCINLEKVIIDGKVTLGSKTFKNCKSLTDIPANITSYGKYSFENCTGLTSITLNNKHIPEGCFRGCENLAEIKDFDNVSQIDTYALDNTGFTRIDLSRIDKISSNILSNCKKLEEVNLGNHKEIGEYAFYRTPHLKINLPMVTEKIGKMAFAYNEDTRILVIPQFVKVIKPGAFAYANYESIKCHGNKTYSSFEDKMLIHSLHQELVLYALGSKEKTYSINNYCEQGDIISPIDKIGEYAFAGAKHLEELGVPSCVSSIEKTAFVDTKNLKTMNVITIPFLSSLQFKIINHQNPYFEDDKEKKEEKNFLPFEVINFYGDNINIESRCFDYFNKLKEINFIDNDDIVIREYAFKNTPLNKAYFPASIKIIANDAFKENFSFNFSNGLSPKIIRFQQDNTLFHKYGLYTLTDDTYLVEENGNIVFLSERDMKKFTNDYELIANKPTKFIDYVYSLIEFDLMDEKILHSGVLMNLNWKNRRKFLANYDKDDKILKKFLKSSQLLEHNDEITHKLLDSEEGIEQIYRYIELLKKYNLTENIFYNRNLLYYNNLEDLEGLIYANKNLLIKVIGNLQSTQKKDDFVSLLENNSIINFLTYVIKYNLKDSFLFQPAIIGIASLPIADKFFNTFDNNTKRLIKNSQVIGEDTHNSIQNLKDLLTLCYITGGLEDDDIIRQKALTFITEKIAMNYDNGKTNYHRISGDNFHRLFNFNDFLRDEFDLEFANFFLENYKELYNREIKKAGFIQRVYVNFRDISKTSTSDHGCQRHKKVTLEKAISFLIKNKFQNVSEDEIPLAEFIGEWYDEEEVWKRVKQLLEENKQAPRNIFTKYTIDENENKFFDNNEDADLKENNYSDFGYEWLPKNNWDNFILGKYCSCCAHINGAGNGIMRASIINDSVQNLVIRDNLGEIVAKSTLYVNREHGYGVFNNVEASLQLKNENLEKIYEAFIRGAKKFLETYNENNDIKLTTLTIGTSRNRIGDELEKHGHELTSIHESINFKDYSFTGSGYGGDWQKSQRIVFSKEIK